MICFSALVLRGQEALPSPQLTEPLFVLTPGAEAEIKEVQGSTSRQAVSSPG